ncbi:16S rRNA (adenine(1518)-N(6)/adenine(1519)-N(6))-dimethyltransferase RsmA [Chryseolinea sp. T2]|uniref:16S rRNA (adenine(1518)-N(6)/adenine(1519)-N(6))- dimethyltransferase RsmA n=1 Tax=Chryseolinea sp. T2 TaxID=3129255 RepID=UPI0030783477
MNKVRPKKSLGQHFLHDQQIARRIVDGLVIENKPMPLLEIGPGMGVLTRYLTGRDEIDLKVAEIDRESIAYLKQHFPLLEGRIIEGDVLEAEWPSVFQGHFAVIGNFPYNISSQIFFKVLENRDRVDQVVCMLQKEVADRLAASHGSKTYGILSVLLQAFFKITYLFKVPPGVFTPPPKVMSAVIRLERNDVERLPCDEVLFFRVVKQAFNTRRKTLRNALKNLNLPAEISGLEIMDKRAEQLSVGEFVSLTLIIEQRRGGAAG